MNNNHISMKEATPMWKQSLSGQSGFTLIEVLIALAVLTIGLTGLAAMQLSSMQYVHSAHYRSLATTIAMDFEERMWLELANNDLSTCPDSSNWDPDSEEEPNLMGKLTTHWTRNAAGEDWDWSTANLLTLPGLEIVTGTPVMGTSVVRVPITLSWSEARFPGEHPEDGEDTESRESFTYNVQIQCRSA